MKGADGVVRSDSKTIFLEPTTPSAPDSVASQHLFDGAATDYLQSRLFGATAVHAMLSARPEAISEHAIPFAVFSASWSVLPAAAPHDVRPRNSMQTSQ